MAARPGDYCNEGSVRSLVRALRGACCTALGSPADPGQRQGAVSPTMRTDRIVGSTTGMGMGTGIAATATGGMASMAGEAAGTLKKTSEQLKVRKRSVARTRRCAGV